MSELSGKIWVSRFPTQRTINALNSPFKENAQKFVDALKAATVNVKISATLRPPERAYLMHFSFKIAMEHTDAHTVPPKPGVDILWVHPTNAASVAAAKEMVSAYGIVREPSLTSHHISGFAIDMTLTDFVAKDIIKADGPVV